MFFTDFCAFLPCLAPREYSQDLTQAIVSDEEGINRLMEQGQKMRTVGATVMNATSSRSHSIFTIVVEMNDADEAGKEHIRVGKVGLYRHTTDASPGPKRFVKDKVPKDDCHFCV